jgi:saccharopine dehydrogenase (NADP+, L-glutamate forming)
MGAHFVLGKPVLLTKLAPGFCFSNPCPLMTKTILVLGAGRSSTHLIEYLQALCQTREWHLRIGDLSEAAARLKAEGSPVTTAFGFDVHNEEQRLAEVGRADLVISMLPANFHIHIARVCVALGKSLFTASYISPEMQQLDAEAREKGVLILMECGLDPGLDHMTAMKVMDRLRVEGVTLHGFETFTGGLVAPESTLDNPWEYKFTWNPRNVVLAGQGGVKFIQEGRYKYIPYHRLFRRTEVIEIPGHGFFEGYANRDSLKYLDVYNLKGIKTLYRGTLRRLGFCRTWDVFVQLGATDDTYLMEGVSHMTHRQFINSFLSYHPYDSVEIKLAYYLGLDIDSQEMFRLKWLGMFDDTLVGLEKGSPAQILEHILSKKWSLRPDDKDMIVMWHKFDFFVEGKPRQIQSHLVVKGKDQVHTAMSMTVGLPLAIAARLWLEGKLPQTGVLAPITADLYEPILAELEPLGIRSEERDTIA